MRRQVFTPAKSENVFCKQIINSRKYVFCILSIWLLNWIVKIWTKPPKANLSPKVTGSCILKVATDFADFVFWSPHFTHTPSQPGNIFRQKTAPASLFQRVSSQVPTSPLAKLCLLLCSEWKLLNQATMPRQSMIFPNENCGSGEHFFCEGKK